MTDAMKIGMRGRLHRATRETRSRVTPLVHRILDRHARGYIVLAPLDVVMRRVPAWAGATVLNRQRVDLTARLNLTFVNRIAPVVRERISAAAPARWGSASTGEPLVPPMASAAVRETVERLFHREQRIHSVVNERTKLMAAVPAAVSRSGSSAAAPLTYPRELIVRRSAVMIERDTPARFKKAEPAAVSSTPVQVFTPAARPTSPAQPIPLSPSELNRLTEQVVRTIDQRIVSHRERMGVIG